MYKMVIQEVTVFPPNQDSNLDILNSELVKHHVLDTLEQNRTENVIMTSSDSENGKTKSKSGKKTKNKSLGLNLDAPGHTDASEIDENDLEELRTVYKKCKSVMKKIESKYGHLLDLGGRKRKKSLSGSDETDGHICKCPVNKKIVFDEDGKEITSETDLGSHICVKRLKSTRSTDYIPVNHVQVEYEAVDTTLPDDLQSLSKILHDPNIELTYRNKVIHKIKMLKQEYSDEIRFNKHNLIEKLKLNPEEILDFKGTNLKSLPGYIVS